MSYDVHLEIDTGGAEPARIAGYDWNYTWNMGYAILHGGVRMYALHEGDAPDGLFQLDGAIASEAAGALGRCIAAIERDAVALRAREPDNGWGHVDTLLSAFLRPIAEACREHPNATVRVT